VDVREISGFMLFSILEGLAIYALIFYIFRFNFTRYFRHSVAMIVLMSLQSFLFREELALSFLAPVVFVVFSILFFATIIRIPFLWSCIMAVTGYLAYGLVQTLIVFLSFGYFSIDRVESMPVIGYGLQLVSSIISIAAGRLLYRKGIGFSFEFERLRFRLEKYVVALLIAAAIISLGIMMYYKSIYTNLLVFFASLFIFLYYSVRKESAEK